MPDRSVHEILRRTRDILSTAQRGLEQLLGQDPTARPMGMHNVAVFGRSVTLILQTLRSVDREAFDEWYEPWKREMAEDRLFAYFTRLRNEILKEGPPQLSSSMYIESLNTADLAPLMADPPPGARGWFMGDNLGGSGWEVVLPDGSVAKYYMDLPEEIQVNITLHLPEPPSAHAGQQLTDTSIGTLARLYLDYLSKLVEAAERRFAPES